MTPPDATLASDAVSTEEKRQLIARIAASAHLRKALRLTDLLRFLTERSIIGSTTSLREHEIGSSVFGREPDYDTSQDNIVRVQVSQLRKKLDNYFTLEGLGEPIIVEIPRGSYMPVFSHRAASNAAGAGSHDEIPARLQHEVTPARPRRAVTILTTAVIILSALSLWLWHELAAIRPTAASMTPRPALDSLWKQFSSKDIPTDVVLADSMLTILQDYGGGSLSLDGLLNRRYREIFPPTLPESQRQQLISMVERRYTSFTDVELMALITRIGRQVAFTPAIHLARDYQMRYLKANNVILLGSKRSNPWVEIFEPQMNFRFSYNQGQNEPIVQNLQPRSTEAASFTPVRDGIGYSVVAFLPNPDHRGSVLILQGENSISTRAAGEFVTSDEHLLSFFSKIGYSPGADPPPWFEVLLRIEKLQESPKSFHVVAYRLIQE